MRHYPSIGIAVIILYVNACIYDFFDKLKYASSTVFEDCSYKGGFNFTELHLLSLKLEMNERCQTHSTFHTNDSMSYYT